MMKESNKNKIQIRIIQINLGPRSATHDALMAWLLNQDEYWIICLQELYFSKKGIPRLPSKYGVYWMDEGIKVKRAVIIAPPKYKGYMVTQYSSVDRVVVRFEMFNVTVVLIYCALDKDINNSVKGFIFECEDHDNVICCMDTNAHYERWGSSSWQFLRSFEFSVLSLLLNFLPIIRSFIYMIHQSI